MNILRVDARTICGVCLGFEYIDDAHTLRAEENWHIIIDFFIIEILLTSVRIPGAPI